MSAPLAHPMHLRPIDLVLVAVYLAGITLFGLHFRKSGERSLRSYFLADRNLPWWAISLSIVAAETSTLTIISVPGLAFTGDFGDVYKRQISCIARTEARGWLGRCSMSPFASILPFTCGNRVLPRRSAASAWPQRS